ncbi:hypothetical protein A3K63_01945 [Candidatus Micrarchaeota archaeon RBG_16_49_10]|nr:MAG: hypothetical protein A3K63_01945 [Candidatus Micrarchaeota archaeon RBG_16_49_10]
MVFLLSEPTSSYTMLEKLPVAHGPEYFEDAARTMLNWRAQIHGGHVSSVRARILSIEEEPDGLLHKVEIIYTLPVLYKF